MKGVDIAEIVIIILVFVIGVGSFIWNATRTK